MKATQAILALTQDLRAAARIRNKRERVEAIENLCMGIDMHVKASRGVTKEIVRLRERVSRLEVEGAALVGAKLR